ncbi:MAG TPA: FAD-dependent hydroxylase [Coleofasciculaceae cyanobacterium]
MALEQLTETPPTTQQGFDYDLAIVGGGIVGATLACALKNSGLSIVLIEAVSLSVEAIKPQAYNLSLLSGRIFEGIGVWDKMRPQVTSYQQIRLSDADYAGIVQFHPTDLGTDALGYIGEHRYLLKSLYEFLSDCPNVSWLRPAEVVAVEYQTNGVEIEVKVADESHKLRSRLIVGADGARSHIRTTAGITTKGWQYWQSCVTARIKTEKHHNNTAFERFWPSGPMGVLPLSGNRCQVVWTAPHAEAQALKDLDEPEFLQVLEQRTGGLLGRLELESPRFMFRVQLMQSDRYTLHRLALIGDAAHCCHPVGGQGLNLGIRDAAALAQVIQQAHQHGEDIGALNVLRRYERWRRLENWTILGFTDFLDRMFSNHWLPAVVVRRLGLWMLRTVAPLKLLALRLMTGLLGRSPQLAQR